VFIFVTDFGIVCLDRLPFYRNDFTRSARAHEHAKVDQTGNTVAGSVEMMSVRSTLSLVSWTLTTVLIFVESPSTVDFVANVYWA